MTDSGGKNAQGLRGFPTPDETGIAGAYLLFLFGDNPAIAQTILGALEPLVYPDNWYLWGDMTTDDAAEYLREVIEQAPYNTVGSDKIQSPFWDEDSGDDADDEKTPEEQDWYGTWDGETFTESLAYVYLTNFLSTLISPQAAIKFLTIPRAFRVAIRQNPHGANLLLFLDGGLYKLINGYSPVDKVVEFLIASPGTELLLVHDGTHDPSATPDENGNYLVDVIRKRLSADEVTPPDVRYTGDPPVFQTTLDGGATWQDSPTSDPRYNPAYKFPPMTPYAGIECDAATRMAAQLKDCIQTMCDVADAAQAVTALLELILLPSGLVGMMFDLLFTIANWIIDNGQATIAAAFTDAVYDDIACTLSCFVNPDGSIEQTALDAAWAKVSADHTGTVATVIAEVRFLFTDVVFSNAAVGRTETGDCSACDDCGWVVEYDFSVAGWGWTCLITGGGVARGTYAGTHFAATNDGGQLQLFLYKAMAGIEITGMSAYAETFHGVGGGNLHRAMDVLTVSPFTKTDECTGGLDTVDPIQWHVFDNCAFTTTAGIAYDWDCDTNGTGYARIYKIRIAGTGAPPVDGVRVGSLT